MGGSHLPGPDTLGRMGAIGDHIPDVLQSTTSTSSQSVVWVGTLPKFLDQWRNITSNRFGPYMVKCLHLHLIPDVLHSTTSTTS